MTHRSPPILRIRWSVCLLAALCLPVPSVAQILAFPEAEGFGRFATGARTNLAAGSVYHVTNLNDSGPGSFRDAVSQANRFVVFDVGGIANIDSVVEVSSNITIAGQTAPGGFVVYGNRLAFHGANNLISRHWAVRKGRTPDRDDDAASIVRGNNLIFDHMSITWGTDGTFDMNHDSGQVIDNITVQNSIIAQGLDHVGHSTGGLIQPGEGGSTSFIKNLWADNVTRNPKVRRENEFINNVVYGYLEHGYIMGDTVNADSFANVEGNYFIKGSNAFTGGTSRFNIYVNDNWVDNNSDGILNGSLNTSYPGATVVATRHAFPTTATLTAAEAVQYVARNAGLSIIRDAVDTRLMDEVLSYGTLAGILIDEFDLFPGYGTNPIYLNPRARFVDADNDGIADNWESANGLNPANGTDWKGLSSAGYTWLEEYVNELGANGTTVTSTGGAWTSAGTWTGGVPKLADDAVATGNLNVASSHAFARRLHLDGSLNMTGGTLDIFDTATVNGPITISGGTATVGRVLIAASGQTETLTLQTGGTLQSGTVATAGGTATLNINGGTFRATGTPDIRVATTLGPAGGTFDTNGYSGTISGAISGGGAFTKQGTGQLQISGPSTYTGPTLVEQGTLKVPTNTALQNSPSIELAPGSTLDVTSIGGGYVASAGQSISGAGRVQGSLRLGVGSTLRPEGEFAIVDYALGIQAEDMTRGADWVLFNNSVHGTGNGGSYNGADLNGGGIVLVNNQDLNQPLGTGFSSSTVDLPTAGTWYLYVRAAEPSDSVVPGEAVDQVHAGANNSFFASNNATTLQTTTGNFDAVQTPDDVADMAKWVAVSSSVPPLSGVFSPIDAGVTYNLTAGQKTFAIAGRELGTILDGFVLSTVNLTAAQLDATLTSGQTLFGNSTGMSVSGNFDLLTGSLLGIDLGESAQNSLFVGGTADLAGELAVALAAGYEPDASDVFTILVAGTLQGEFSNTSASSRISTVNGGSFAVNYDYANNLVTLSDFGSVMVPGDYNNDGIVNAADYVVWRNNVGGSGLLNEVASPGTVDIADYLYWRERFGASDSGAPSTAANSNAVPEPPAALLLLGVVPAFWRRTSRSK